MANAIVRLGYKDAAWFTANAAEVLEEGQHVYLLQTGTYKIGDGVTPLSGLSFLGGSSGVAWGSITGTLSAQTDLNLALNARELLTNKATSFVTLNNTLYPTTQAVANYVGAQGFFTLPALTNGSILFSNGTTIVQDNAKFFWDDTNDIIYVGANSGAFTNSKAHFESNINAYSQINSINKSAGTSASSDYIATANNGTDTSNFVDVGINSSGFSDAAFTIVGALGSYVYSNGGELAVGTGTANTLRFFTGGTLIANSRMYIDSAGLVNIGTAIANPTSGQGLVRIGQGTTYADFGEKASGQFGIWMQQAAPSNFNYTIYGSSAGTFINGSSSLQLQLGATTTTTFSTYNVTIAHSASNSGARTDFNFTGAAHTLQTASTNIPRMVFTTGTRQFSNGATALQEEIQIVSPTYSHVSGSNTITLTATISVGGPPTTSGGFTTATTSAGINVSTRALTGVTTGIGLISNAPTGATNNYSASFTGGLGVLMSATNIVTDTTTGLKIATATTQKIGAFNATPVVQPNATTDLGVVLSNLGWRAAGTAYPITTSGVLTLSGAATFSSATDTIHNNQNIQIGTAGKGLIIKAGSNARIGQSTLVGGTVTVSNTSVTANTKIFLQGVGATNAGFLYYTISAGVSFTITSSIAIDARAVDWLLVESN